MSFNPITLLEKAINEHGSASILKERLAAVKEELAKVTKERDDIQKKLNESETERSSLRAEIEKYKKKDGFIEYRGALFKRKATGGYDPTVYCRICFHPMASLQGFGQYRCQRDKLSLDFTGEQLPGILKEVTEANPSDDIDKVSPNTLPPSGS